jgi:hypothetical protein
VTFGHRFPSAFRGGNCASAADAERAARELAQSKQGGVLQEGITGDPGCAASSLWIFDNTGNAPGAWPNNHEICFFRNGNDGCVNLENQYRYCTLGARPSCAPWAWDYSSAVESFWAGIDAGYFTGTDDERLRGWSSFGPWEREDDAQTQGDAPYFVLHAQSVCLFASSP